MEFHADEVLVASDAFKIYRSGKMDRLHCPARVPTGFDPTTGVTSKDVVLDATTGLSVRLFLPSRDDEHGSSSRKLPVLVFFHGGAFLIESAVSPLYHGYVASLAAAAGVLAVSVEYRLAPEHPVPAAYDDAWAALRWAASSERDEWLAEHGDASRLFLAGDSAGGNMVHHVLVRLASAPHPAVPRVEGAILLHPWFGGSTLVEGEDAAVAKEMARIWEFACPDAAGGADDPRTNPMAPGAPALESLRCERMLVCAGEKDWAAARDRAYYAAVAAASAWPGRSAWLESEGEGHVFFLEKPECAKARELMDRVVKFIDGSRASS